MLQRLIRNLFFLSIIFTLLTPKIILSSRPQLSTKIMHVYDILNNTIHNAQQLMNEIAHRQKNIVSFDDPFDPAVSNGSTRKLLSTVDVFVRGLGTVRGKINGDIDIFYGIPYGLPPIGEYRWSPPRPVHSWNRADYDTNLSLPIKLPNILSTNDTDKYLDATVPGPSCIPATASTWIKPDIKLSEDCLYLNIWIPRRSSSSVPSLSTGLPVVIYFHGGGFITGSGLNPATTPNPVSFVNTTQVIFISINYRLGSLGFIAHPNLYHGGGLFGLQDQYLAMEWVVKNIGAFGGNQNDITLIANSAGAVSVCLHLVYNIFDVSKNGTTIMRPRLFQKIILQSPLCAYPFENLSNGYILTKKLIQTVGCQHKNRTNVTPSPLPKDGSTVESYGLQGTLPSPVNYILEESSRIRSRDNESRRKSMKYSPPYGETFSPFEPYRRPFLSKKELSYYNDELLCLRNMDPYKVQNALPIRRGFFFYEGINYFPIINGIDILGHPIHLFQNHHLVNELLSNITVIYGHNKDEASIFLLFGYPLFLTRPLVYDFLSHTFGADGRDIVWKMYFNSSPSAPTENETFMTIPSPLVPNKSVRKRLVRLLNDMWHCTSHYFAEILADSGILSLRMYEFDHYPTMHSIEGNSLTTTNRGSRIDGLGAYHGLELNYVFGTYPDDESHFIDYRVAQQMMKLWGQFIYQNDTPSYFDRQPWLSSEDYNYSSWLPYASKAKKPCLRIQYPKTFLDMSCYPKNICSVWKSIILQNGVLKSPGPQTEPWHSYLLNAYLPYVGILIMNNFVTIILVTIISFISIVCIVSCVPYTHNRRSVSSVEETDPSLLSTQALQRSTNFAPMETRSCTKETVLSNPPPIRKRKTRNVFGVLELND